MHPKKREKLDILEQEEFPKENGERLSNGTGSDHRSERSEVRQPDVMDDQPDKSRSTFHSCHTPQLFLMLSSRSDIY